MIKKIFAIAILFSISIFGSGFQINEHAARAMAAGGAFTAIANDASAVYFNPAGLIQLSKLSFTVGTTLIAPSTSFRGPSPSISEWNMDKQSFFPSHFYAAYPINDKLAVGFGFYTPFGLGTRWANDWVGKFIATDTKLATYSLNPVVAYMINDWISIGGGFSYNFADVKIARKASLAPFNGEALVTLDGSDKGTFGFNAGLLLKPHKKFSIGFNYHSQMNFTFKGTAVSEGPSAASAVLPSGDVEAKFTSPQTIYIGLATTAINKLLLSFDIQLIGWSSYDSLKVDFKNENLSDISSPRLYENSYCIRFGGEYELFEKFFIRAGILLDKNPIKDEYLDPLLPDSDRWGFSGGFGYSLTNNLTFDFAYLFIRSNQRTIENSKVSYAGNGFSPFNGTYNSTADLVSVTFNYSF